jgi:ribosomal protein L31
MMRMNLIYQAIPDTWFSNTPILCDGKPLGVGVVGSTKPEFQVDLWLAKYSFYTKSQTMIDSKGRVERFMKKIWLKFN